MIVTRMSSWCSKLIPLLGKMTAKPETRKIGKAFEYSVTLKFYISHVWKDSFKMFPELQNMKKLSKRKWGGHNFELNLEPAATAKAFSGRAMCFQ